MAEQNQDGFHRPTPVRAPESAQRVCIEQHFLVVVPSFELRAPSARDADVDAVVEFSFTRVAARARKGAGVVPRGRSLSRGLRPIGLAALLAMMVESASAHDKDCDGGVVSEKIKSDCCGEADEHQLSPEQIGRGPNGEYIVSVEGYTFVIPADKALPSNDTCSHVFFPNMWTVTKGGDKIRDPTITPKVRCFFTPLGF